VGESGARDLSEALATNGALRYLDLSGNAIGVAGVEAIARAVGGAETAEDGAEKAEAIARAVGGGGSGGGSGGAARGDGGAAAAPGSAAASPSPSSSASLSLLLQSASLTSSCRLTSLTLRGVGAGPECGATLGAALVASGTLRRLELSHNALADGGVVDLVGALRRDRCFAVSYLGLEHNGVGNRGGAAIASLVPGLRVRCLEGNAIEGGAAAALRAREEGGAEMMVSRPANPTAAAALATVKLHLLGDSGAGKTKLARALGRHWNLFSADAGADDEPRLPAERTRGAWVENIVVRGSEGAAAAQPFRLYDHGGLESYVCSLAMTSTFFVFYSSHSLTDSLTDSLTH
jgi:hypothetical protein